MYGCNIGICIGISMGVDMGMALGVDIACVRPGHRKGMDISFGLGEGHGHCIKYMDIEKGI